MRTEITDDWLGDVGFKWRQEERQPNKHWTLWLGWGSDCGLKCIQDIGIEITRQGWKNSAGEDVNNTGLWMCWIVSHSCSRKAIHVRDIPDQEALIKIVEALTGNQWNPVNHLYGNCYTPAIAEQLRKEHG